MEREDYIREIRELAQKAISLQKKIEEKKSEIKSTTMKLESLDKEIEHAKKGLAERDKLIAWLTAKKIRLEQEIRACHKRNSGNARNGFGADEPCP